MNLTDLQNLLDKEEVIETASLKRLKDEPQIVKDSYREHLKTYLPLTQGEGGERSITQFRKELLARLSGERGAAVGYLVAEYGYGKTSTAAYLWQECDEAGMLAVPPFQMKQLTDLFTAAYYWGQFQLKQRGCHSQLEELEASYSRHLSGDAPVSKGRSDELAAWISDSLASGRIQVKVGIPSLCNFLSDYHRIALAAGFKGVALFPDEVQQYVAAAGERDSQQAEFFNLISGLSSLPHDLRLLTLFIFPTKELQALHDIRPDIMDRLQKDNIYFDLNDIYDADFAKGLWQRLADSFGFGDERERIVSPLTLRALGEIAASREFGSGPRTVVSGFKYMLKRYKNSDGQCEPLSHVALVDAFRNREINFDAAGRYKQVLDELLAHPQVEGNRELETLVKQIAAFPRLGLREGRVTKPALLSTLVKAQLVSRKERSGSDGTLYTCYSLRVLEPRQQLTGDWLTNTVGSFLLDYAQSSAEAMKMARQAFSKLLPQVIFSEPDWKTEADANRGLALGGFSSTKVKYPQRLIAWQIHEASATANLSPIPNADITLDFSFARSNYADAAASHLDTSEPGLPRFHFNLAHEFDLRRHPDISGPLHDRANNATPMMLLNIYLHLDEQSRRNLIPGSARAAVEQYQAALLKAAASELFSSLSATKVAAITAVETLVRSELERLYPDYIALLAAGSKGFVDRYVALLTEGHNGRMLNPYQKAGLAPVEVAGKIETAALLGYRATEFDGFTAQNSRLIKLPSAWPKDAMAEVRFTIHPLEQRLLDHLDAAGKSLPLADLLQIASAQGYRKDEFDAALRLLTARGRLVVEGQSANRGEMPDISVAEVAAILAPQRERLARLSKALPQNEDIKQMAEESRIIATQLADQPDQPGLYQLRERLLGLTNQIDKWYNNQLIELTAKLKNMTPLQEPTKTELAELEGLASNPATQRRTQQVLTEYEQVAIGKNLVGDQRSALERDLRTAKAAPADEERESEIIRLTSTLSELWRDVAANNTKVEQLLSLLRESEQKTTNKGKIDQQRNSVEKARQEAEALGEAGREVVVRCDNWLAEMQMWTNNPNADLEAVYSNTLNPFWREIERLLDKQQRVSHERFSALLGGYKRALQDSHVGQLEERRIGTSLERLHDEVLRCWQSWGEQQGATLTDAYKRVSAMRSAADGDIAPSKRRELQQGCDELDKEIAYLRTNLDQLLDARSTIAVGPDEFAAITRRAADDLLMPMQALGLRVNEVERLTGYALTHSERELLKRINTLVHDGSRVNVDQLKPGDNFWVELGSLHRKLRLTIEVQPRAHDEAGN